MATRFVAVLLAELDAGRHRTLGLPRVAEVDVAIGHPAQVAEPDVALLRAPEHVLDDEAEDWMRVLDVVRRGVHRGREAVLLEQRQRDPMERMEAVVDGDHDRVLGRVPR